MKSLAEHVAVIILAAGMGTRMKSEKAKVLHEINGSPMILHVVETAKQVVGNNIIVVVGYQADSVQTALKSHAEVKYALQEKQLGTGHAVKCALPCISDGTQHVIVLCGDVPLLMPETISAFFEEHAARQRSASVLAVKLENPFGYGRIIYNSLGQFNAIVEEADATEEQKKIKTINTGIYCFEKKFLIDSMQDIKTDNRQGEMYLTDLIKIGYRKSKNMGAVIARNPEEFIGVNSQEDLRTAQRIIERRRVKIT